MSDHGAPRLTLHPLAVATTLLLGVVVGGGLGASAGALLRWFESTFDSAPGPIRVAAALPDAVAIGALAVIGLVAGLLLVGRWEEETLVVRIEQDGLHLRHHKRSRWVTRTDVANLYLDRDELVVADSAGRPIATGDVGGVGRRRIARALGAAGYPFCSSGNPHEGRFTVFVEGRDDLGATADLLTRRAAALAQDDAARARELRAELGSAGVLVRDRRGEQEYVVLS